MSVRSLLILVLAIVGLGALGNAMLSGGSVTAHGGDASVLHLCVSKVGSLKSAFVVSPSTSCPAGLYDSVHVQMADGATSQDQTCPKGHYVAGTNADGSLVCNSFVNLFYVRSIGASDATFDTAVCDPGDVALAGGFASGGDAPIISSWPGAPGGTIGHPDHKDKWTVTANGTEGLLIAIAICMDVGP